MLRPSLRRLALFARHHYRSIFVATAIVVALAGVAVSGLRFETDILALLPKNEPTVEAFREALEEFGSLDYLPVAVRIPEGAALGPYEILVDRIGERLQEMEEFEQVDYRLGDLEQLLQEFLPKALLFLETDDLERVAELVSEERLRLRAAEIKRLITTPQSLAIKQLLRLDPLGLAELFLDRLQPSQSGLSLDWASGYLLSRDRRMMLVLAKPERPPQDVDFARRLVTDVLEQVEAVRGEWPEFAGEDAGAAPEVVLGGRYVIAIGDEQLIRRDVIANILTSTVGVLLLFLLAFRRFGPLLYAILPLAVGLTLTFGLAALAFGGLSVATSGTAALLIGLGIDFVIVSYGRFVEERRAGANLPNALSGMSGSSGRAVVVGGVTSAATFYAFGVTDFTGLYQMGYLTGTGILLCMAAVLLLLPSMLAWSEDHHERRRRLPRRVLHGFGAARWIRFCIRHPVATLAVGIAITLAAAASAVGLRFDDSVTAMRPKGNPATAIRDEIAARYGSGFDQMILVMRAQTLDELMERVADASTRVRALVDEGVLNAVDSIDSLLPPPERQRRALEWLERERQGRLDPSRIETVFGAALAEEGVRLAPFAGGVELFARAIGRTEAVSIEEIRTSPQAARLLDRYLLDGAEGWKSAVYLYPPAKVWRRAAPPQAKAIADQLGDHAVLTGANVVSEFMRERVLRDAVFAAALGMLLVAILLWLDFRDWRSALLSLVPLIMGIVWMLGAMAAAGIAMNFMNIFVSTMIIGIGVDYGIHMIHRYRELGSGGDDRLYDGLVETGKAILLAALSTVVGFGSLSRSHYPGLSSMGIVAILGALSTCLVSISLLPAAIALYRRRSGAKSSR